MTLERDFSSDFNSLLRSQGAMIYPLVQSELTPPGWPDRLVVHQAWMGLVELKAENTICGKHQQVVMRNLNRIRSGVAYQVRLLDKNMMLVRVTQYDYGGDTDLFDCPMKFFLREVERHGSQIQD